MAAEDIYKFAGYPGRASITTLRDVSAAEFITAYSAHLKKGGRLELPSWVDYVKTSHGREMPPSDTDWYFVRAASIARKIYLNGGIGVGALAHWYGKANKKGVLPQKHHQASRKIIRTILIQLEELGLVEKTENGGRQVTSDGMKDLDTIARTAALIA
jgi:small subunit ribosomal protein S19e